jgi:translocator protein
MPERLLAFGSSAIAVGLTLAVAGRGTRPTTQWYQDLIKPSWQPDPALIGIAWTILYPLIAVVGGLVLLRADSLRERLIWAAALLVNLVLNALWSWIFFTWQRPDLAAIEIGVLLLSCVVLIVLAGRHSPLAAGLLVPYALWVGFAGWLTFTIARLN